MSFLLSDLHIVGLSFQLQFGVLCRDGVFSIEYRRPIEGKLVFGEEKITIEDMHDGRKLSVTISSIEVSSEPQSDSQTGQIQR